MLLPPDPTLHPGDRVRIVCTEIPELCVERSVGPDGSLDVPMIGAIASALRRPSQLSRDIAALLDDGRLPPRVDVRFVGPPKNEVGISGAVENSFRVYAPNGIDRERLLRAAAPQRDADMALFHAPVRIAPGRELILPFATADRRIGIVGAVATPQSLPPANALVLSSALETAGGLTAHGDPKAIVLVRAGESIPLSLPEDGGFLLQPGDVVRVGTVADRQYVMVRGLVARPGSVEYAPGMTATRALAAAGGLLPSVNEGTLVWRTGSKSFRLSLSFLLNRRIPDPILSASDTLEVEAKKP